MANSDIGTAWLVEMNGSPREEHTGEGKRITHRYHTRWAEREADTAAWVIGQDYNTKYGGGDTDSILVEKSFSRGKKNTGTFTVVYTNIISEMEGSFAGPVGTTIYESDSAIEQIPIEKHPDYSVGAGFKTTKPGVKYYLVPQPVWRVTSVTASEDKTEANIIENVGTRDNTPTGMTSVTANKWLKMSKSIRWGTDAVEIREEWQYSGNIGGDAGWDTDIYD